MDGDHRTVDTREYSHRLARGMRRDLFRRIDDRYNKCSPVLRKRLEVTRWPHRSVRARCEAYDRAYRALKDACAWSTGYQGSREVGGLGMRPCVDRTRLQGFGDEDVLRVDCVHLSMKRGVLAAFVLPIAYISQHAVERMFQRLDTMDVPEVEKELSSSMSSMALIASSLSEGCRERKIGSVVIPTARGAFVSRRPSGEMVLDVRTFVSEKDSSPKIQQSINSIREWQGRRHEPSSIRSLLSDPRNRWWCN